MTAWVRNRGADRGWLDQVVWIPETIAQGGPTAPGASWESLDDQSAAGNGVPNWIQYVSGLHPSNEASSFPNPADGNHVGQSPLPGVVGRDVWPHLALHD